MVRHAFEILKPAGAARLLGRLLDVLGLSVQYWPFPGGPLVTIPKFGPLLALLGAASFGAAVATAEDRAGTVTIVSVPGGVRPVAARLDPTGVIHLLCDSETGPRYIRSRDGGATFGPSIPVVIGGPQTAGLEYQAWDLAVGRSGRVHVAMSTNAWKLKLPEEEWGYFHAYLDPDAPAFSPVRNINKKPSEGFSLAADDTGRVTACWLSDKLYANVSHDDGATFAPQVELSMRYDPCDCCTTSAVYGADGRLAVLYREETHNERDMYLVLWDQAEGRMTRARVGNTPWKIDGCPMTYFRVARDRDGYVVVWPTKGEILFARLDAEGAPISPAEVRTIGRSGMRSGMVALTAPDGSTLVAWNQDQRIGWQLHDPAGRPVGEPGSVASSGHGVAGVVGTNGRFVLFRSTRPGPD